MPACRPATDLLDDALARDPSASGQVHAARARAAGPTRRRRRPPGGCWSSRRAARAYELYATGDGFWDAGQDELTAPYVARYFAEIGGTARFREGWALGPGRDAGVPADRGHARTRCALADAALGTDLAAQVRRAVVDGTDRLRRAVASLRRWTLIAAVRERRHALVRAWFAARRAGPSR